MHRGWRLELLLLVLLWLVLCIEKPLKVLIKSFHTLASDIMVSVHIDGVLLLLLLRLGKPPRKFCLKSTTSKVSIMKALQLLNILASSKVLIVFNMSSTINSCSVKIFVMLLKPWLLSKMQRFNIINRIVFYSWHYWC